MKVAIFGQFYHSVTKEVVTILFDVLYKNKIDIYIESDFSKHIKTLLSSEDIDTSKIFSSLDNSFDLLISIGGDGTILRAITYVRDLEIPIVGINTGRLGFLATIQNNDIETAITQILKGKYKISERSLISIETDSPNENIEATNFALNEITVSRKNTTSMITVETSLDGEHFTSYWSDGLIVSTPTGSTGYSLSCGGPVITPQAKSFVLTPIAPHNLSARPLVIPDSTEIKLKISGREEQHLVSLDSRIATLDSGTEITLKRANFTIKMIELPNESFLDTLRKKLLWGEDKRN